MKRYVIFIVIVFSSFYGLAQANCYPTNWWVGMKNHKVQIMIHETGIANKNAYTINYPGVKLEKINKVESVGSAMAANLRKVLHQATLFIL